MNKKIIAFVNRLDERDLKRYSSEIYFCSSINDFESNLKENTLPVLSLGVATRTYRRTLKIIESRPDLRFYFLEKRRKNGNWNLRDVDWKIRNPENTEGSTLGPEEVVPLSFDFPVIPIRILKLKQLTLESHKRFKEKYPELCGPE